ncbi:unnamed protein product [Cyclocybe aegerita]|uniref:Uncharacterized protein n=1 Tax=Cyclocybe aegerita TaxID=1973307 RepID=A0A8S0VVV2_CYCAE|nr:unnamed protein product [Cyclocybe aegerita]
MNANFTFPPPKPVMPRPPSAYRPKAKIPSRSSNALRASVLEAALELGVGTNPLVADWMFSNSLKEEDEEDSAHSPGLTNGSSATSEESSSYPLTPPASSSKRGPGPGVHFADDPVSNGKPGAVAVAFPSAGKDAVGRSNDADNSNSGWSHEHGVAPSSLAPSGSGSGVAFPDIPIPPRPTTSNNGRRLKKKRGADGGYESDGGYVSDTGKKKEKKEKKEKKVKEEEKVREGEGGEGERTRKKSLISVVKSSKKKDKEKERDKDASFDVGYDTDGGPTSSAKKPKRPSKTKTKTAEAGYETDGGYVSSSGTKRSKARAFFGLSSKSSRSDLHAEAEPVPALPRGFGGKEMPLPIADRFATTLSPTNASASASSSATAISPTSLSPASVSSSVMTPLGRTTSEPSPSASSPISPSPSATQLLGTGTLPQMSFQPFSAADSPDTQLSPSRSRSPLPPPSRSMSPVASPTLSPTIKRDSLMSTNSSSSSGSGSNSNSQNHGQQHSANGSTGGGAGGGAGGGSKRRFFGFASPTKGDAVGHGIGSGSGSTITSTSTSVASHTHSAKSGSNASSATTHSAAGSLKPPMISFPLTRSPSPSSQPMSPGRSPTPTSASVLPFASSSSSSSMPSSSQTPAFSSLASPLSPSSASQLPMRSPSPGLPRSPASPPPVVPLNINRPRGMRVRPSLEKLNLLAPPINTNPHNGSVPSPISPNSYVMVTPVPSPGLPPSPNTLSRSMTRGGSRDGGIGPPSPGIMPSGDYLVPSPSAAATSFMLGASPAPGAANAGVGANGGLTSPNVLAYYDMPPPSPPPQGPLPSVPPNAQPGGSSSSSNASASVNTGQFPFAALRQRVVDRTPRYLPPELANVQRGRESPFPARPVLPAGGVAPPAGMPRRYRDLYTSPTGSGPGEETLAYLEEKERVEEMRRARIAATGGQKREWVDLEEVERDMVKEKLMKIQRKKKGAVRFAVDVDGGSEEEDELEYIDDDSVEGGLEDEPELRGVLDRFDNGSAEGASVSEESVFSQRALSRNRSAEALNVDAEGMAIPRLRVPRERPRQLSEYTDDDARTLGDRASRWSDSVYSRVSILDEDESEQTRDRFVRRVEAMLEAERKRNALEGLVGDDETGAGLGLGRGYIPPVPKLPEAYSNSNLGASPVSAGATSPGRSWNRF